jgi:trehalose synthase
MVKKVRIHESVTLEDYSARAHLAGHVRALKDEAAALLPKLGNRKIWMVNSAAQGGGVAEMLPKMISLLRELGLDCEWVVLEAKEPSFFNLTKRLHNMIHGQGRPELTREDRNLYEAVNRRNAEELMKEIHSRDILVVHDPQPMPLGTMIKKRTGVSAVWRCHIGLDEHLPVTLSAWEFLRPYITAYDHTVFSAPEYIPSYLAGRVSIIHPAVDPLSHKNRELNPHKLVGILCNSSLMVDHQPVLTPPFSWPAERLRPDGTFISAKLMGEIGLLYRPIISQISRWDRLKGYAPLLKGFVKLKERLAEIPRKDRRRRRLELLRLVLAGPDPASIQDDPEGLDVLRELCDLYCGIDPQIQKDVALLTLPMESRKENALMVNAVQRCSTIVVQNSISEGFGLTATEAMWKRIPVMGTLACGLRQQIRDGLDGRLVSDPNDSDQIAEVMEEMISNPARRQQWAQNAQRRVHDDFLIFTQLRRWLKVLYASIRRESKQSGAESAVPEMESRVG